MDKKRLTAIFEAYGADAARWPESERAAALALMAQQPEVAVGQRSAASLDALLDKAPQAAITNALRARILEAAPPPRMAEVRKIRGGMMPNLGGLIRVPNFGGGVIVRPVAILAIAICLGLGAGALLPLGADAAAPSDTELLTAMWGSPAITQDGANL